MSGVPCYVACALAVPDNPKALMATACSNYSPALHEGRASCECRRGFSLNVYVVGTNERAALPFLTDAVGGGLMWPFFRPSMQISSKPTSYVKKARFYRKGFPRDGNRGAGHVAR